MVPALIAGGLFLLLIIVVVVFVVISKKNSTADDDDTLDFEPEENMFETDAEAVSGKDYYRYHLDDDVSGEKDEDEEDGYTEEDTDEEGPGEEESDKEETDEEDGGETRGETVDLPLGGSGDSGMTYTFSSTDSVTDETDDEPAEKTEEPAGFEDGVTAETLFAGMSEKTLPEGFFDGGENHTEDEYEILRSGKFYIRGLADSEGKTDELDTAITDSTVYMATSLQGIKAGLLVGEDGKIYLISDEKQCYLELSEAVLKMMGVSGDDLANLDVKSLSDYEPLSEAAEVNDTTMGGIECKEYVFKRGDGTAKVYISGNRLLRFANFGQYGILKSGYYIKSITADVPLNRSQPDPEYKKYSGMLGMAKFFALLLPKDAKPGGTVTEDTDE